MDAMTVATIINLGIRSDNGNKRWLPTVLRSSVLKITKCGLPNKNLLKNI